MRNATRKALEQVASAHSRKIRRRAFWGARAFATLAVVFASTLAGHQLLMHPDTPLPAAWNPTRPLVVTDAVTPVTSWKLDRTSENFDQCRAALAPVAAAQAMSPLEDSEQCYIADRMALSRIGQATLAPVETRCAIALRLAMWEEHSLQPAAQELLGASIAGINHIGSYNCRRMRTVDGPSTRFSTHATADAIDISGFELSDGDQVVLLEHWEGADAKAEFLRRARDGACQWFDLTLSPDFNRLHADHFHLQSTGWGSCR